LRVRCRERPDRQSLRRPPSERLDYSALRNFLVEAETVTVASSERTRFTKPVFVLTSEVTVSAGEGLVMMLRAFRT
jgi:hypothetical protein